MIKRIYFLSLLLLLSLEPLSAMHIMEGYLPWGWCVFWYALSLPLVVLSYFAVSRQIRSNAKERVTVALNAAFVFILSALKLPSVTGSSSHLTGTTMGTLTSGLMTMPLIGAVVLLFQALILAHGGISTLGANVFSLAVAGPLVAYGVYKLLTGLRAPRWLAISLATVFGSLATYVTTAFQLAVAFPEGGVGVWGAFVKFLSIFAVTQIPLALVEALMTVYVIGLIHKHLSSEAGSYAEAPQDGRLWERITLYIAAGLCLVLPLMAGYIDFGGGTDDAAGQLVEQIAPQHQVAPWFEAFEPSEALEPWLFVLQALVGVALFYWGYRVLVSRRKL